jgi:hypothetical protein
MRGIDYSNAFLVKVWLTINPIKGLFMAVSLFIIINSYLLMMTERREEALYVACYKDSEKSITSYRDACWVLIITFLTVGYGDFYPKTYAGRYIAVITAMGG